jgi:tRNA(Arg) A34 adenosine deaminase TadA/flavin reductase (DIM6/NTAB) family NADH-FMN oxidoreductase RutF
LSLFEQADPAVYLVSARAGAERAGMIASWVTQATLAVERPRVLAVISVATRTRRLIEASGRFALQLLDEGQAGVVARFALPAPEGLDKWEGFDAGRTRAGLPLVAGGCGFAECAVVDRLHTGDRVVYLADVVEERVTAGRSPLRERAALAGQPPEAAEALRRSYELDVRRDDALLRRDEALLARTREGATDPVSLMRLAIAKTREGLARGQAPFGCAIAREGAVLAVEHNRVIEASDVTAHAEVAALRAASRRSGAFLLPGALVATTCEPCPMCATALHFARVEVVYYGAGIADAEAAGFRQVRLAAGELLALARSATRIVPDVLADECRSLFAEWRAGRASQPY